MNITPPVSLPLLPAVPGAQPHVHAVPGPGAAHQSGQAARGARKTRRVWLQAGRRASSDGAQQHQLHLLPQSRVRTAQHVRGAGA